MSLSALAEKPRVFLLKNLGFSVNADRLNHYLPHIPRVAPSNGMDYFLSLSLSLSGYFEQFFYKIDRGEARERCRVLGGKLADLDSWLKWIQVKELSGQFWVGAKRRKASGKWFWSNGKVSYYLYV